MEEHEKKEKLAISIEHERLDANRIAAKHIEAKIHQKQQKVEALSHFKAVWDAQKNLKERNEAMENVF